MNELLSQLKERLIENLKKNDLKSSYLIWKRREYTVQEVIDAINTENELGVHLITNICLLSLDLLQRGKEVVDDLDIL